MAPSKWSVKNISATQSPLDRTDTGYGNVFDVKFEMEYEKTPSVEFEEMPLLDWHEKFTVLEHGKEEWWTFEANMYEHNRTSRTLKVWTRRYVTAYETAMGLDSSLFGGRGSCTLYKKKSLFGKKVTKLPKMEDDQAKADAVREYLRRKGGKLEIVISDRPALIIKPDQPINKERLLLFDVGVMIPGSRRWTGYQHLVVNGSSQTRDASVHSKRQDLVPPSGYREVDPDPIVSNPRDFPMSAGESW